MKNTFILFLLAASLAIAQRQSVVVLPSIADPEAKLSPRELDLLTDKVRSIIPNILPLKDFNLLKQDVVKERLGEEGLYLACKEGSCVGDLVARVQADFGARCEVLNVNRQLYLKFELYGTLKGESEAGTIDQFNDPVRDFTAMLALIDKKVPAAFKKIVAEPVAVQMLGSAPAGGGSVVARIATEPAGAVLEVNGVPYQGCPKTPCAISLYENRFKLSAALADYETADTNLVITVPNQLVTVKLKPVTYSVSFASQPSGVSLSFGGEPYPGCRQTPCNARFTKGNINVTAALNMHESKDTAVFVSRNNQLVNFRLLPNFGTLRVSPSYVKGIGEHEEWAVHVDGRELSSYESNLMPGRYSLKLTHECYEDVNAFVDIERGKLHPFSIAGQGVRPKPVCAEAGVTEKVDAGEFDKAPDRSFWGALALDIIGLAVIGYGYAKDLETKDSYADYQQLNGRQADIDGAWQKADDARKSRNVSYVVGSLILAAGIGVHIWF